MKGLAWQTQGFDHLTSGPIHYSTQDLKPEDRDSGSSSAICQLWNSRKTIKLCWSETVNH